MYLSWQEKVSKREPYLLGTVFEKKVNDSERLGHMVPVDSRVQSAPESEEDLGTASGVVRRLSEKADFFGRRNRGRLAEKY